MIDYKVSKPYLRKADQSQAVELGIASSSCESGRKRPKLGLWHRCAVAVVDENVVCVEEEVRMRIQLNPTITDPRVTEIRL